MTHSSHENFNQMMREKVRKQQLVGRVVLVITLFQLINLAGAIYMKSLVAIGIVVLALLLCAIASLFNYMGNPTVAGILLVTVVDLVCVLMLLTLPMGLDVIHLAIFDTLIVSELITISLLPPHSIFFIAAGNILFILADIFFQSRTRALSVLLSSPMAFNIVAQPISLQIIVAAVAFLWVQRTYTALERADRAEEMAELQRKVTNQKRLLTLSIDHLSEILTRAANGEHVVRTKVRPDDPLWYVANSLNLLLTKVSRSHQVEAENRQLHAEASRLKEAVRKIHKKDLNVPGGASRSGTEPPPKTTIRFHPQSE